MSVQDVPSVYMAGKIGIDDWRHRLLSINNRSDILRNAKHDFVFKANNHLLNYCGPFFVSCDHCCYHGENSHGWGLEQATCEGGNVDDDNWISTSAMINTHEIYTRQAVKTACLESIKKCDFVYSYIDKNDCYGTILEIGYALALGKPCLVCFENKYLKDEIWFVSEAAEPFCEIEHCPHRGLTFLIDEWIRLNPYKRREFDSYDSYESMLKSPKWQKKRLEIMTRDNFQCQICGDNSSQLHVHHKKYKHHTLPWDYINSYFTTLCDYCHAKQHGKPL